MEAFGRVYSISVVASRASFVRQWIHILNQLVDGFGIISSFSTWCGRLRSEVVASLSLWPRSVSTTAVACILLVLLVNLHLALCSRRLPAGAVVAHATDHGNRVGNTACAMGCRRFCSFGYGRLCDQALTVGSRQQ